MIIFISLPLSSSDADIVLKALMQHVTVPHMSLPQFSSVELVRRGPSFNDFLFEVSAVESVPTETKKVVIPRDYQQVLDKFPELLKPNFMEAKTKHQVVHRIDTQDHPPCFAKVRPLVPGSPKAKGGEKDYYQICKRTSIDKEGLFGVSTLI